MEKKYQVGDTIGKCVVTKALFIEEIQAMLYELVHKKIGSHVMHIANDDKENLFSLSF